MDLTLSAAFLSYPARTHHASPHQTQQYLAGGAARLLSAALVVTVIIPARVVVAVSRRYAE